MIDFLFRTAELINELNRLLGTRFLPGHPNNDMTLGMNVENLFKLHNSCQYELRDFELLKLSLFVKHLREIEASRSDLLPHFRRALKRAITADNFFGIRFEINIAASLIRHRVPLTKSESPDFVIDNTPIAIECGSVRVREHKPSSNLAYKIASCIRSKEKKGYHNPHTSLFIDFTNLSFQSGHPELELFRKTATEAASEMSFGSVLLFTYIMNREFQRFESNYIRIDHMNISSELRIFLDIHFPIGHHILTDYTVPWEG